MRVLGKDLRPGDTIEVWWQPKRDTIMAIEPYTGPLAYLWPKGAIIAKFAINRSGMTIDKSDYEEVVNRT